MKQRSQVLDESKEKQAQEAQQYKEQAQTTSARNLELKLSLDAAVQNKKNYMEELELALTENISYVVAWQTEVDALNMKLLRMQRWLTQAESEQSVLSSIIIFANDKMEEAQRELAVETRQSTQLASEKQALEVDLHNQQSYMIELQSWVERLMTNLEIANSNMDGMQIELETLELSKKMAEEKLKEAQEDCVRTEKFLEKAEQKYE